ncbi:MAG: hypothetical protein IMHGJWDQ_001455 [Candidatus Fervidibacter sp.]
MKTAMGKKRRHRLPSAKETAICPNRSSSALMEWTIHLAQHRPLKATLTAGFIAVAVAVGWIWVHPFLAMAAGFFLVATVSEFLFPVHYRLTEEGAQVTGFLMRRSLSWAQVRRVTLLAESIHLSPYPYPTPLDNFRGLTLWWTEGEEGLQRLFLICRQRVEADID